MGRQTQNVRLHESTVDELYRLKDRKDSYDDVVRELIAVRDQLAQRGELDGLVTQHRAPTKERAESDEDATTA